MTDKIKFLFLTLNVNKIQLLMSLNSKMIRYITSDCDAVSIIRDVQGYAKTPEDAVGDVLKAGNVGPSLVFFLLCLFSHDMPHVSVSQFLSTFLPCNVKPTPVGLYILCALSFDLRSGPICGYVGPPT